MLRQFSGRRSFGLALALGAASLPAAAGQLDILTRVFDSRRASDTASGASWITSISSNGRYVVFLSEARNLVPGQVDGNFGADVFLRDEQTGTTVLVSRSVGSPATTGDRYSLEAAISADGRYVAFSSRAGDLVPGQEDTLDQPDIFLFDRITETTTLVSHAAASQRDAANGECFNPTVSADGRYVAFGSYAPNLMAGQADDNFAPDIFLWDRTTGRTVLVSHVASSATRTPEGLGAGAPSISADGRFVAFESGGSRVVPGQTGTQGNVFLYDRTSGKNLLVSRAGNARVAAGGSTPALSANGEWVAFTSSGGNLVSGQTGPIPTSANVFVFHRPSGRVSLVSRARPSPTQTADANSFAPRISADGSWVAFVSFATNLLAGQVDSLTTEDVFLWERASGAVRLVSRKPRAPATTAGGHSTLAGLSGDGKKILLVSNAGDLVAPPEPDAGWNVYLADRSGAVVLLSSAGGGRPGNGDSRNAVLSRDGNWVALSSEATNLDPDARDLNEASDVFLYRRASADLKLLTWRDPASPQWAVGGQAGNLSADGRFAVFAVASADVVPQVRDGNGDADVFLYDRVTRTGTLVSHSLAGPLDAGNAASWDARISGDGRYVIYRSNATDLVPSQTEGAEALFLFDRATGQNTLVSRSVAVPGRGMAVTAAAISADGSTVAFTSLAPDLIPGQTHYPSRFYSNVFLYDTTTRVVTMASHALGLPLQSGRGSSDLGAMSADGRYLVVESDATDLIADLPSGSAFDTPLYLHDRTAGTLTLITRPGVPGASLQGGEGSSISADGRFVAFTSSGNALVPGQIESGVPGSRDVFLWDRETGTTKLVSHLPDDPLAEGGGHLENGLALSADGGWLAFVGPAALVPGYQGPFALPILLYERSSGTNRLVGAAQDDEEFVSSLPAVSPSGRYIAFASTGRLSAEPIATTTSNVFLFDRTTGGTSLVSRSPSPPFASGNGPSGQLTFNGRVEVTNQGVVLFESAATNLAVGDYNRYVDVFLFAP